MLYCLISEGKDNDEAGVALTLQKCTRDATSFDVRRVNAHSRGLTKLPRGVQEKCWV